jgi:hypothetical protein
VASGAQGQELVSGGLGLLALALGAGAILGVVRPGPAGIAGNVPVLALVGLVAGVLGLYAGRTRGPGRQLAVLGTGVTLVALMLFGGALALDLLLDAST